LTRTQSRSFDQRKSDSKIHLEKFKNIQKYLKCSMDIFPEGL